MSAILHHVRKSDRLLSLYNEHGECESVPLWVVKGLGDAECIYPPYITLSYDDGVFTAIILSETEPYVLRDESHDVALVKGYMFEGWAYCPLCVGESTKYSDPITKQRDVFGVNCVECNAEIFPAQPYEANPQAWDVYADYVHSLNQW